MWASGPSRPPQSFDPQVCVGEDEDVGVYVSVALGLFCSRTVSFYTYFIIINLHDTAML